MTCDLMQLVAARKQALEADANWADYTDVETADAFARLDVIQSALLGADLSCAESRLIALSLLLENDDQPNFADDFKNRLFACLRSSSAGQHEPHPSTPT